MKRSGIKSTTFCYKNKNFSGASSPNLVTLTSLWACPSLVREHHPWALLQLQEQWATAAHIQSFHLILVPLEHPSKWGCGTVVLLQDKAPAPSRAHPKVCAQRRVLFQMAGAWICPGHAEPPAPSTEHGWALRNGLCNEQVAVLGMPNGWQTVSTGKGWALSRKNVLDRGAQPCSFSWCAIGSVWFWLLLVHVRVAVYQEVDGAIQGQQIWCSVCDVWSSLAAKGALRSLWQWKSDLSCWQSDEHLGDIFNAIGEYCVDNLFGSRPRLKRSCCAVTSHSALVKGTHCEAHHLGTAAPLGDRYRLILETMGDCILKQTF